MQTKDTQGRMPRTAIPCTNTNGPHAPTPAYFQDAYKVHLVTSHSFHTLPASMLARWTRMHAGKCKAVTFEGMQMSSAERAARMDAPLVDGALQVRHPCISRQCRAGEALHELQERLSVAGAPVDLC